MHQVGGASDSLVPQAGRASDSLVPIWSCNGQSNGKLQAVAVNLMLSSLVAVVSGEDCVESRVHSTLANYSPTPNVTALDPELYRALVLCGSHRKQKQFDGIFAGRKPLVDLITHPTYVFIS